MTLDDCKSIIKGGKNDAALLYISEYAAICKLPTPEMRDEAFRGFFYQAFTEQAVQSEDYAIDIILSTMYPSQISRQQRHQKAVSNGEQGGRPAIVDRDKIFQLREMGYTQQQIANELCCHVNTVRNVLQCSYPQKPTITNNNHQQKPTITTNNNQQKPTTITNKKPVIVGGKDGFAGDFPSYEPTITNNNQQKPLDIDVDKDIDIEKDKELLSKGDRQSSYSQVAEEDEPDYESMEESETVEREANNYPYVAEAEAEEDYENDLPF